MDSRYLREFLFLAQTQNYLDASAKVGISQSALSKHIQALENELGHKLFIRSSRYVVLSPYGKIFFNYATKIVELENKCESEMNAEFFSETSNTLNIATVPAMRMHGITDFLAAFIERYPDYKLMLFADGARTSMEKLRDRTCSFAFVRDLKLASFDSNIQRKIFSTDYLQAVVNVDHPLAHNDVLYIDDLKDQPLISAGKDSQVYRVFHDLCQKSDITPRVLLFDNQHEHIFDFVRLGMGIGIVLSPPIPPQTGIKAIKLSPGFSANILLCYRENELLSPCEIAFKEFYEEMQQDKNRA